MIQRLRKILGLETMEEQLQQYVETEKELSILKSEIDEAADDFITVTRLRDQNLKTQEGEIIKSIIELNYNNYLGKHISRIKTIKENKDKLQKTLDKLNRDENISKAIKTYKEEQAMDLICKSFKEGKIEEEKYHRILKAKQGKIHYSDVIVRNDKGEILLLKRGKENSYEPEKWCLPGGHVDPGEDHLTAAIRELQEETGIECKDPIKVGVYEDEDVMIEYYESIPEIKEVVLQEGEHVDYKWCSDYSKLDLIPNLKENLDKIYNPIVYKVTQIKKAFGGDIPMEIKMKIAGELIKGRKANIGEIREWGGKKMKKVSRNEWVQIGDNEIKLNKPNENTTIDRLFKEGYIDSEAERDDYYFNEIAKKCDEIVNRNGFSLEWDSQDRGPKSELTKYSSDGYHNINGFLRTPTNWVFEGSGDYLKKKADIIQNSINNHVLNEDVTVYRGCKEDFVNKLKEGSVFKDKAFASTSLHPRVGCRFKGGVNNDRFLMRISLKRGQNYSYINSGLGEFGGREYELLLGKGLSYQVDKIDHKSKIIELSIVEGIEKSSTLEATSNNKFEWNLDDIIIKDEEGIIKSRHHKYIDKKPDGKGGWIYEYNESKHKEDRSGNIIGDGSFHVEPVVVDMGDYNVSVSVNKSNTSESSYVTYVNNENGKSITVRFSNHENNATKFGDQLDGNRATRDEILYHLGLKDREFIPETFLLIKTRQVSKVDAPKYEEADKTIQELYALGEGADLSQYKGKLAKGSRYLIEGDNITKQIKSRQDSFGREVQLGKYTYKDIDSADDTAMEIIKKAYDDGFISEEIFLKAQQVYKDNTENRRLKRVGKPYGSNKGEQPIEGKGKKGGEEPKEKSSPEELTEHAKQAGEQSLINASKNAKDPEVRVAAHKELDRREKEEHVQEEKEGEDGGSENKEKETGDSGEVKDGSTLDKFKDKIKNWTNKEKEFFERKLHLPNSRDRRKLGELIRDKTKGIVKAAKHEVKEIKIAGEGIGKLFQGKKITDEEKNAVKVLSKHLALTIGGIVATGGASHLIHAGLAGAAKGLFAHYLEHVGVQTLGRALIFASDGDDINKESIDTDKLIEQLLIDFADWLEKEDISEEEWIEIMNDSKSMDIEKSIENNIEKAHKYIRREGSKGDYKYFYPEEHGTDGGHVNNIEDNIKNKKDGKGDQSKSTQGGSTNGISPHERGGGQEGGGGNAQDPPISGTNEGTSDEDKEGNLGVTVLEWEKWAYDWSGIDDKLKDKINIEAKNNISQFNTSIRGVSFKDLDELKSKYPLKKKVKLGDLTPTVVNTGGDISIAKSYADNSLESYNDGKGIKVIMRFENPNGIRGVFTNPFGDKEVNGGELILPSGYEYSVYSLEKIGDYYFMELYSNDKHSEINVKPKEIKTINHPGEVKRELTNKVDIKKSIKSKFGRNE